MVEPQYPGLKAALQADMGVFSQFMHSVCCYCWAVLLEMHVCQKPSSFCCSIQALP